MAPTPSMLVQLAAALDVQPCELHDRNASDGGARRPAGVAGKTIVEAAAAAGLPRSTGAKTERGQRPAAASVPRSWLERSTPSGRGPGRLRAGPTPAPGSSPGSD